MWVGMCQGLWAMITVLFLGDIVGRPGRDKLAGHLGHLRTKHGVDLVIANGENAAAGAGITAVIAKTLLGLGVDAITLGDHVRDQRGWESEIGYMERVCRPANLPALCPGRDHVVLTAKGFKLAVFTVLGRQYLNCKSDCPFLTADALIARTVGAGLADAAFIEVHAEATSEKIALGWHLDGRAMAVIVTHTHVPTADARVLPQGTAYLTDAGMTGPYSGVLGRTKEPVIEKFLTGMPQRFPVAEEDPRISGALVRYEPARRRAVSCELLTVG